MSKSDKESQLAIALRHFEIAEANLSKLERVWEKIESSIPDHISFDSDVSYEENCRTYATILTQLPDINGWKPSSLPLGLNEIGQMRFDAQELGEISTVVSTGNAISAPGRELRDYKFRLNQKRRELIRETILSLIDSVDKELAPQETEKRFGGSK